MQRRIRLKMFYLITAVSVCVRSGYDSMAESSSMSIVISSSTTLVKTRHVPYPRLYGS